MKLVKILSFLPAAALILSGTFFGASALAQTPALNSGAGTDSSYNWSGYEASNGSYTGITSSWVVPNVPSGTSGADAAWVGIGGVKSSDLIQVGTQAIVNDSSVTYQAWYEMLPGISQTIPVTINPGDSVTASLSQQSANQWSISLRDNTNGQNFQTVVSYDSSLSSAEWIEEMPSQGNGGFIPLDSFGTVSFSNASAVLNGTSISLAGTNATPITMVNSQNQTLASSSAIGSDGESFTVTRGGAAPTTAVGSGNPFGNGRGGGSRVGRGPQGFSQNPGSGNSSGFSSGFSYRGHRHQYQTQTYQSNGSGFFRITFRSLNMFGR